MASLVSAQEASPCPFYVATPHGQLRMWQVGDGPPVVVLPGLINAAESVARRLQASGINAVVVELPGIGGSAGVRPTTVQAVAAAVASALDAAGLASSPLLALDLCAPVATELASSRPGMPPPVLLNAEAARHWAERGCRPPPLSPRDDGTHLTALFAFLRDRHVLGPAAPWRASGTGDPLPDLAALNDGVVAAGRRPAAFRDLWSVCLAGVANPMAGDAADDWDDACGGCNRCRGPAQDAKPARRGPVCGWTTSPRPAGGCICAAPGRRASAR